MPTKNQPEATKIEIALLLRDIPGNNSGGRPTKQQQQQATLKRQKATADSRDGVLGERSEFTARPGTVAKRKRNGRGTHQPTGKQFLGKKVAKQIKGGCVAPLMLIAIAACGVLTCLLLFVLFPRRFFTGSVIDSRRDGEDVLFKVL